jgi:predicted cupin superfamily sugar epimerase
LSDAGTRDLERLIVALDLKPHPEGGFFRETYRAAKPDGAARDGSTAIYFLLGAGEFSAFHLLREADEMWHHYAGDPVELHTISPAGAHRVHVLGADLERGERPQVLVPAGTLQAAIARGPRFGLCGCTVTPGFEFSDFDMPARDELRARHPQHEEVIVRLTRSPEHAP